MLCPVLGSLLQESHGHHGVYPARGQPNDNGAGASQIIQRQRSGAVWMGEEKAWGGLVNVCDYLKRIDKRKKEARLFSSAQRKDRRQWV